MSWAASCLRDGEVSSGMAGFLFETQGVSWGVAGPVTADEPGLLRRGGPRAALFRVLLEPVLKLGNLEAARPRPSLVGNLAVDADDIQPLRPRGVSFIHCVVALIH